MLDFSTTSIPGWAARPGEDTAGPPVDGVSYIVIGVGSGKELARRWATGLPDTAVVTTDDTEAAEAGLAEALGRARVGVRIALAGPVGACLRLRAASLQAGSEDDEIHVQATEAGAAEVCCAHCSTGTSTAVGVDGVVPCTGCGRDLLVYHHVSRRLGQYLGFQVDAETLPADPAAPAGLAAPGVAR